MLGAATVIFGSREASAGALEDDELYAVAQDTSFVYVAGYTKSFGSGGEDVIVQKFQKSNGQLMWTYLWGLGGNERAHSLVLQDGNPGWIYVTGQRDPVDTDSDAFVLKLTKNGVLDTQFGAPMGYILWGSQWSDDCGRGITITGEQPPVIYVTGTTWGCSWPGGQPSIFILKLDQTGINLWQNLNQVQAAIWDPFMNEDYGYSIACNYENGEDPGDDRIYVTGYSDPFGNSLYDGALLCYDDLGNPVTDGGFVNGFLLFGTANAFDYSYSLFYDSATDWLFMTGSTNIFGYDDLLYFSCDGHGQNQVIWYWSHSPWEGEPANYGWSVWYDGTYIWLTGYSVSAQIGVDIFIAQCDLDGAPNTENGWPMRYDYGFLWAEGYGITVDTANSRMYVAGWVYENSPGLGSTETFLGKFQTDDGSTVAGWPKVWSDAFDDYTMAIKVTDNAIYSCGYTYGYRRMGYTDAFVAKHDLSGNLLWWHTWDSGTGGDDRAYAIGVTESAVFIAGSTYLSSQGVLAYFIMKYDLAGQAQNFGGANTGYIYWWPNSVANELFGLAINNNILYCAGYKTTAVTLNKDIILIDSSLDGNSLNNRMYTFLLPDNDEVGYAIDVDSKAAFVAGYTTSRQAQGGGNGDALLIKFGLDPQKRIQFINPAPVPRVIGSTSFDCAYSVDADDVPDNGFVYWSGDIQILQLVLPEPRPFHNSFVEKCNKNLNPIWLDHVPHLFNNDIAYSVKLRTNNLYVAGYKDKYTAGGNDVYLRKYDLAGNKIWQTNPNDPPYQGMISWGGSYDDVGRAVDVTDNIYTSGWTLSYGPSTGSNSNGLVLKHTTDGNPTLFNYRLLS
jgi:hypothetical protein